MLKSGNYLPLFYPFGGPEVIPDILHKSTTMLSLCTISTILALEAVSQISSKLILNIEKKKAEILAGKFDNDHVKTF